MPKPRPIPIPPRSLEVWEIAAIVGTFLDLRQISFAQVSVRGSKFAMAAAKAKLVAAGFRVTDLGAILTVKR